MHRPHCVHLLAEPLAQRAELAPGNLRLERARAEVGLGGVVDLHRHDRAERVRREVADRAKGPVDVLQAAARIVGHVYAQVLLHAPHPVGRHLGNLHLAAEERALDVVPQDHVQRVRDLVRLDADAAGRHAVVRAEEVGRRRLGGEREARVEEGRRELPERLGLQHHPLPQQRLRLVHAHGERPRGGQPQALLPHVPPLLVQRVAALVDRRAEALRPVGRVSRRHAHVLRARAAGEWVGRHVEPAVVERVAHLRRNVAGERRLRLGVPLVAKRERRVRRVDRRVGGLLGVDRLEQRHQARAKLLEDLVEALCAHAALKRVERAVVRLALESRPRDCRDLLLELEDLGQLAREEREVRRLARRRPRLVRLRLELRLLLRQLGGLARLLVKGIHRVANVRSHPDVVEVFLAAAHAFDRLPHLGASRLVVKDLCESPFLLGARSSRPGRHEDLLVVAENPLDLAQRVDLSKEGFELLV
mmetsp:Transcript_1361/g.4133  ORF Transcript_1361/g.4133 Transcript_1361/m.4133 type:complete len:475 (-) Transcript_1361:197-1621(-)